MNLCPPARLGVAKCKGGGPGGGSPRLHNPGWFWFLAGGGSLGTPGPEAKLYPCAARGATPLATFNNDFYPYVFAKGIVTGWPRLRTSGGSVSARE